jgi:hypothetical protein
MNKTSDCIIRGFEEFDFNKGGESFLKSMENNVRIFDQSF